MKKVFFIIACLLVVLTAATAQPVMTLDKTEVDYGTIAQNSDPLRKVKFKNTGNQPLIIKEAHGSCGCTVPTYKKEPIMPGETSEIEIRYATDRIGDISKTVTVTTNAVASNQVILVKGKVIANGADAAVPSSAPTLVVPKK